MSAHNDNVRTTVRGNERVFNMKRDRTFRHKKVMMGNPSSARGSFEIFDEEMNVQSFMLSWDKISK